MKNGHSVREWDYEMVLSSMTNCRLFELVEDKNGVWRVEQAKEPTTLSVADVTSLFLFFVAIWVVHEALLFVHL